MLVSDLFWKKIVILWFWAEGKSTLEFLNKIWIKSSITILDKNKNNYSWDFDFIYWDNYLDDLSSFDIIIKSPWISPYNPKISPYKNKLTSQTEIFYSNYKWKIISVTATKWKSTTSTLIYETLKLAWYKVKLVWNIWTPVLTDFALDDVFDYVIYELSSYMLENLNKSDYISILWNIYPDHLDRHDWFDNYKRAKKAVLAWSEFSLVRDFLDVSSDNILKFWKTWDFTYFASEFFIRWDKVFSDSDFLLDWEHNMFNICSVMWVCDIIWVDISNLIEVCKTFSWLPYRLEKVSEINSILFIDDSLSTTPESTMEAVKTYNTRIWTIILWWFDRWYDYFRLIDLLNYYKVKNFVLLPDTHNKIIELLDKESNYIVTKSMEEAVNFSYKNTKKWWIVLLSTAAPSYNLWANYKEKSDSFRNSIALLK